MKKDVKIICLVLILAFAISTTRALAQDEDSEQASGKQAGYLSKQELDDLEKFDSETIVVKASRLRANDVSTSMAQTIEVKDCTSRLQTVTQIIADAVGVKVRTIGGLGSYGSASIRGSTPNQVPVYIDGVLLNAGGFDTVNLGDLSLDLFERIDIYRSGAPSSLGTVGIGGAIRLQTRSIENNHWESAMSAGSDNTYRLMATASSAMDIIQGHVLAMMSASSSKGDFLYFDNNGTSFNPDDDSIHHRNNNSHRALTGLLKLDTQAWGWHLSILDNVLLKDQGIAGMDTNTTEHAKLTTSRNVLTIRGRLAGTGWWSLRPELSYLFLQEEMKDTEGAHGELGMGREHVRTTTHTVASGALFQMELTPKHFSSLRADLRWERLLQRDLLSHSDAGIRQRLVAAAAAQHQWTIAQKLSLLPSGRIQIIQSRFDEGYTPASFGCPAAMDKSELLWQLALGSKWNIMDKLSIVVNIGKYVRPPTLGELFGYRGTVVGNPSLASETGFKSDIGLELAIKKLGPFSTMQIQVAGFVTWTRDLIAFWQNSQNTVKAQNIDAARVAGIEINTTSKIFKALELSANYTFMDSRNQSDTPFYRDKALPGRPVHELYTKLELFHDTRAWSASVWCEASYTAGNFLDPSNMKDAGARTLLGTGLKISSFRHGLSLSLEVNNLLNTTTVMTSDGIQKALEDFEGFPLPGRTILVTLRWKTGQRGDSS